MDNDYSDWAACAEPDEEEYADWRALTMETHELCRPKIRSVRELAEEEYRANGWDNVRGM